MSNKTFLSLALLALALGGILGAVLIIVLDGNDDDPPAIANLAAPSGDTPDMERLMELAGRMESGDVDAIEELEQIAGQLASGRGPASGFPVGDAGPRMIGSVQSLDGDTLTISTPIGPMQADITDDTEIVAISEAEGAIDDLAPGLRITLSGQRNDQGALEATTLRVIPEGLDLPVGGGLGRQQAAAMFEALGDMSEEDMMRLAQQAAVMATGSGLSGNSTVESPADGVVIITDAKPVTGDAPDAHPAGPPVGSLAIPGRTTTFSFAAPGLDGDSRANSLTGVIESMDGQTLQLTTPRGPVAAVVAPNTAIIILTQNPAALDDLSTGAQVLVSGQPDPSGNLQAQSVTLLPNETVSD